MDLCLIPLIKNGGVKTENSFSKTCLREAKEFYLKIQKQENK